MAIYIGISRFGTTGHVQYGGSLVQKGFTVHIHVQYGGSPVQKGFTVHIHYLKLVYVDN